MSNCFHLAVEAGNLDITSKWYTDVLGCDLDMAEEGKWQDINFFGNELTLHSSTPRTGKGPDRSRHHVDMGAVCVPHFGIHLNPYKLIENAYKSIEDWIQFIQNLPNTSNKEAADLLRNWVIANYEILNIEKETIKNYINNASFLMQVVGIRN